MDIATIGAMMGTYVVIYAIYQAIKNDYSKYGEKFRPMYSHINSLSELKEKSKSRLILFVFQREKGASPKVRRRFENVAVEIFIEFNKESYVPICWSNIAENEIGQWIDEEKYGIEGCLLIKNGSIEKYYNINCSKNSEGTIKSKARVMYDEIIRFKSEQNSKGELPNNFEWKSFDASQEGCFIATATYGDYNHYKVIEFRKFRDGFLLKKRFGKFFIQVYYFLSPHLSSVVKKNTVLKQISQSILDKIYAKIKNKYR